MGLHSRSLFRHFSLDRHFVFGFGFYTHFAFLKGLESTYITEEGNTQKETDYGNSLLQNNDIQNELVSNKFGWLQIKNGKPNKGWLQMKNGCK